MGVQGEGYSSFVATEYMFATKNVLCLVKLITIYCHCRQNIIRGVLHENNDNPFGLVPGIWEEGSNIFSDIIFFRIIIFLAPTKRSAPALEGHFGSPPFQGSLFLIFFSNRFYSHFFCGHPSMRFLRRVCCVGCFRQMLPFLPSFCLTWDQASQVHANVNALIRRMFVCVFGVFLGTTSFTRTHFSNRVSIVWANSQK